MTADGVSRHSVLYPENSKKVAHEKGVHAYLRQSESHHSGGIAFSITERGAVWLGGDQTETYDESRLEDYLENLEILDYQVSGNLCMVLVGPETCRDDVDNRSHSYPLLHRPAWVDETPSNHGFIYAAGISEGYYYSVSSWDLAEKMAHRNLSASIQSRIQGLHDQATGTSHEILYSDQKVTLNFAVVTSRYHDPATNLYYVLVRMPIR